MKSLNLDNWLDLDPAISITVRVGSDGGIRQTRAEDWIPKILRPALLDRIPEEVSDRYESAKSAILYGLLFMPLLSLGVEELYRVAEAAVYHRCAYEGAPKPHTKFQSNISFLIDKGIINAQDKKSWRRMQKSRDYSSHMRQREILNPASTIEVLYAVTNQINSLFDGP